MTYSFKLNWEFARVVLIAAAVFALNAVVARPDFADWQQWLPVVGTGCVQAAAAAALALITRSGTFAAS